MNETEEDNIPLELKEICVCFCSFYHVRSPLELEESWSVSNKVIKCVILITKNNSMVELENGNVKRVKDLTYKNSKKVIIHQEFEPFSRFVILLTADLVAHLFDYRNLEEVKSWSNVIDILSEDLHSEGKPKLILKRTSGSTVTVDREEFLLETPSERMENSRIEAITALNNKLKSVVWFAESLETERVRKEAFIAGKIQDLSSELQGINRKFVDPIETSSNTASSTPGNRASSSDSSNSLPVMKVLTTRQRIVHNQWVIGVAILNNSDKYLIRNPEILLHSEKSIKSLQYRTRVLRTYQKVDIKNRQNSLQESDVIIEDLKPPVIKPKRKAFLFAVCTFPDFSYGETLSCSGIITYQTRSLRPDVKNDETIRQTPFSCVSLSAKNLSSSCADIVRDQSDAGLSFSVSSLIVASKCHILRIKSLGSPLDQIIEKFRKDSKLVKVERLSNFFCNYTPDCQPLHLAAFICKPQTANELLLKTYTRDDNQAIILIHNISKYLPMDAYITPEENIPLNISAGESFYGKLLPLMKSIISKIEDAFLGDNHRVTEKSLKRTEESTSSKPKYEIQENEYCKWRKELSELTSSMEMLRKDYSQ